MSQNRVEQYLLFDIVRLDGVPLIMYFALVLGYGIVPLTGWDSFMCADARAPLRDPVGAGGAIDFRRSCRNGHETAEGGRTWFSAASDQL